MKVNLVRKTGLLLLLIVGIVFVETSYGFSTSTNALIVSKIHHNALFEGKPGRKKLSQLNAWGGGNPNVIAAAALSESSSSLKQFFFETAISVGVPAAIWTLVAIILIKTAMGSSSKKREYEELMQQRAEQDELLGDLLNSDATSSNNNNNNWLSNFRNNNNRRMKKPSPKDQPSYFKITPLHDMYRSYNYTMTSAITSTALAQYQFQTSQYQQALERIQPPITLQEWKELQEEEEEYCKVAYPLQQQLQEVSAELQEQNLMNFNSTNNKNGIFSGLSIPGLSNNNNRTTDGKLWSQYMSLQKEMVQLDLEFQTALLEILGTSEERISSIQLLTAKVLPGAVLGKRPLDRIFQTASLENEKKKKKTVYVLEFDGDVTASQVDNLREEVSSILVKEEASDNSNMEVVLKLSSPGGTVTGYGLAAAQLTRLRDRNIPLTICVEQVAASGGYMMSCVANRIIASPFAVLGSIGVISDLPNFYQRLKDEGIEFQTVTAGKYKRTLTPTKKVTKEDLDKSKEELEQVLDLFKGFVHKYRPQLDIDKVATGETWFGDDALRQNLCDSIATFDDTIAHYILKENANVYKIEYTPPTPTNSLLANVLPSTSSSSPSSRNPLRFLVRSFVQMVKDEITSETTAMLQQQNPQNSVMARSDDRYNRIRMKKEDNEFYF